MTNLNGGYVMVDLASTKVYEDAKAAVAAKKPILIYDNGKCYYADTFEVDGDGNVVITKGGKTITIEADGDVVSVGDVQPHLYRGDVRVEFLDDGEATITYAVISLLSNSKEELEEVAGAEEFYDYLIAKGYTNGNRLTISGGKYISVEAYENKIQVYDEDDNYENAIFTSNFDNMKVIQIF